MCGQAGIHSRNGKPVAKINELADELLRAIESRGKDATGFIAMMKDGKVQLEKSAVTASRFIARRGKIRKDAKTVLLHTRYATVGTKTAINAHPVASGTIAAVHNGTIYNATEIFNAFGLPRKAQVDSEIIPALINHAGWGAAASAIDLFEGGMAAGIINTEKPEELILARTQSYPMVYMVTDDLVIFASTEHAIRKAWLKVYGKKNPMGTFHEMARWTMARVNGSIEVTIIREAPPEPKRPAYKPPTRMIRAGKTYTGTGSKRARKRSKKAARQAAQQTYDPTYGPMGQEMIADDEDYYIEQAIRDLCAEGFTLGEAYDMIDSEPPWNMQVDAEEEIEWYGNGATNHVPGRIHTKSPATLAWEALG